MYKSIPCSLFSGTTVLLLLPDLKYGFVNSEALLGLQARKCRVAPSELLNVATRHIKALSPDILWLADILWPVGPLFVGPLFGRICYA